jgi:hypothetical protein
MPKHHRQVSFGVSTELGMVILPSRATNVGPDREIEGAHSSVPSLMRSVKSA